LKNNDFQKLAQVLLSLRHNKNNNLQQTNKNNIDGSDITRTKRTETRLTDFFGVDSFTGPAGTEARTRTENDKTTFR
jgi:hypothetical protein